MLCSKCYPLSFPPSGRYWKVRHHSSFAGLEESAERGCMYCALFLRVLLDYYAYYKKYSVEQAAEYHRHLDLPPNDVKAGLPALKLSSEPEVRQNYSCGEEEPHQGQPSSWFEVRVITRELSFAPITEGIVGFYFVRVGVGDGNKPEGAVDGIKPLVDASSLHGSVAHRKWSFVKRSLNVNPNFSIAKGWLRACDHRHRSCKYLMDRELPRRILDVGSLESDRDIRLLAESNIHSRYATLSHCWGTSQPMQLTSATMDKFQTGIEFSSLPQTFQHAVTATRLLGLQYLWIDSLCIIQDSITDWQQQCAEMNNIYRNSYVTLAGPASSGCHTGFLGPRPILDQANLRVCDEKDVDEVLLCYRGINHHHSSLGPEENSPLHKRAWVLQERLLSRCFLSFGTTVMYFECAETVQFEDCYYPVVWHYENFGVPPKINATRESAISELLKHWDRIVDSYSRMSLTKPEDKLPALSGLASELQQALGFRYVAGIWQEDIPRALTWSSVLNRKPTITISSTQDTTYTAPSWSWAALNHGSHYPVRSYDNSFHAALDVCDLKVTMAGLDPFGAVTSACIKASGLVCCALVKESEDSLFPGNDQLTKNYWIQSSGLRALAIYYPDHIREAIDQYFSIQLVYLGHFAESKNGIASALGIEPVDGCLNTYRRIGVAYEFPPSEGLWSLFHDSKRTALLLI